MAFWWSHIYKKMIYLTTILLCMAIQTTSENGPPEYVEDPRWPESSYYIQDGPPIILQCDVRTNTDTVLYWYKDGDIIKPHSNAYVFGQFNSTLTFLLPKHEQSGKYSCVATNSAGNISHAGFVFIKETTEESRPLIISTSPEGSRVFVDIGDAANISCTFDVGGSDIALIDLTLEWQRGGLTLNDTNHTSWELSTTPNNDQVFLLLFDSILNGDYGEYICYGENTHGNDTRRIFVLPPIKTNTHHILGRNIILGSAIGGVLVVILSVFAIALRRHRLKQNVYEELSWPDLDSNYEVPERTVEFDVFISYSSDDLSWVKDVLLDNLQSTGYRVCIDFKDFTPGLPIAENIMDSIYRSRKTLVLMSRSFLRSMWGQFELQQAHHRAIMQRKDVLIVVKYDSSKVPMKLMGKTFLDWTDPFVQPHFWSRLYDAIGSPVFYGNSHCPEGQQWGTKKEQGAASSPEGQQGGTIKEQGAASSPEGQQWGTKKEQGAASSPEGQQGGTKQEQGAAPSPEGQQGGTKQEQGAASCYLALDLSLIFRIT